MLTRQINKVRTPFKDPDVDAQVNELVIGLDCWLGIQDSDPSTADWGSTDFFIWVNNATPTAKVIKFWDGDEVKTVAT